MLQRDYPDQVCSIARSLEIIGERWTLLILRDAMLGLERFEDFQASLGIASNVLTNRLKLLCDEQVLERVPDPQRPGRPKYVLTDKGRELGPALIVLMKWGDRHYPTPHGPPRLALHTGCGGGIGPDLRCDRCGKQVGPGEIDLPPGPGAPRDQRGARQAQVHSDRSASRGQKDTTMKSADRERRTVPRPARRPSGRRRGLS